jgi:hypothetical protein
MSIPLVSVVIPTHNRAVLVGEAVDSVLAQSGLGGTSLDVIVVDDGSTDDTAARLASYVESGAVRYIVQKNAGAGPARNRGIDEARGSWIAFLDSDDLWEPYHLSVHLSAVAGLPDCHVFFSDFSGLRDGRRIPGSGTDQWTKTDGSWKRIFPKRLDSSRLGITGPRGPFAVYRGNIFGGMMRIPCMPCWTTLVAKSCLPPHVRFATHLPTWEDYWFSCRLAETHETVYLDVPTALNRAHRAPRLTNASFLTRVQCHLDVLSRVYLPSSSPNRPSDVAVIAEFAALKKTLFKELVKCGRGAEAEEVGQELRQMGIGVGDIRFEIYRAVSSLPAPLANQLTRLRRRLEGA